MPLPSLVKEYGIPWQEDVAMISLLSKLDPGDEISPALYTAVAEIITFAYIVNGKIPEGFEGSDIRTLRVSIVSDVTVVGGQYPPCRIRQLPGLKQDNSFSAALI